MYLHLNFDTLKDNFFLYFLEIKENRNNGNKYEEDKNENTVYPNLLENGRTSSEANA